MHLPRSRPAFTLIEILISLSVIAVLAAMAMPVLSVAGRAARTSATRSVMHKVSTALDLFRTDIGAYPYQATYADLSAGERPTNRLGFHLGSTLTPAEIRDLHTDADAAAAQYTYDCFVPGSKPTEKAPVSAHVFTSTDLFPAWSYEKIAAPDVFGWKRIGLNKEQEMATCVMLNRMGAERARLAIWSGALDLGGCRIEEARRPDGTVYRAERDNSAIPLLPGPKATAAKPGWADDYLRGELEARYRDGEVILDAWRRPLVYVCQVVEGMKASRGIIFHEGVQGIEAVRYGLDRSGRRTLAASDPVTGLPTTTDGEFLPDPARLQASDRRRWAAPGLEFAFELWSAGPDGRFDWFRTAGVNVDNVGHQPYDRRIPR